MDTNALNELIAQAREMAACRTRRTARARSRPCAIDQVDSSAEFGVGAGNEQAAQSLLIRPDRARRLAAVVGPRCRFASIELGRL
jgi:hypothetical protein